jgi:hypothetical protein
VGHDFPLSADSLYHQQVIAFHHAVAESDVVGACVIAEIAGAFRVQAVDDIVVCAPGDGAVHFGQDRVVSERCVASRHQLDAESKRVNVLP